MTDLGISGGARAEANTISRSFEAGSRIRAADLVIIWRVSNRDCIARARRGQAPAVENNKGDRSAVRIIHRLMWLIPEARMWDTKGEKQHFLIRKLILAIIPEKTAKNTAVLFPANSGWRGVCPSRGVESKIAG